MRTVILASESPRRKDLLASLDIPFKTVPSNIDEESIEEKDPHKLVLTLARLKAEKIAPDYPEAVIVAGDTVVYFEGNIMGKPKDIDDARRMLTMLRGTVNMIVTGCVVMDSKTKKHAEISSESKVFMKHYSDDLLERYIASGHPLDKAGAYGYLGVGVAMVDHVVGSYFDGIGLPLGFVIEQLESFGVEVLGKK